ncbi:MAG: RAD55 family ATPase, partial [Candidatus Hydrothermarchaeaceae archaeon]
DSLSPLFLHNPESAITKAFQVLASRARKDYGLLLATLQEGVHPPNVVNTLIYLVDGYLQMKFEEEDGLKRKLRVHHLKGIEADPNWQTFEISKEGIKIL